MAKNAMYITKKGMICRNVYKLLSFLLLFLPIISIAQSNPKNKEEAMVNIVKAGSNRSELEKVILYFKKSIDPLKLETAYFLIANMDIHHSADYYWIDSLEKKVRFQEFSYPDFNAAEKEIMRNQNSPNLIVQKVIYPDLEYIKADFLIKNIENAFKAWKTSDYKDIAFKDFCEYILPYRATFEPLQDWRITYNARYKWVSDSLKTLPLTKVLSYMGAEYNSWFFLTYGKENRIDPLPRLGAQQLLFRKKGNCEDIAALQVFALRSQGIPASYDIIPSWGTATGTHFGNTAFDTQMKPLRFDVTRSPVVNPDQAEPAKVIRLTYSKQKGVLASIEKEENIPPGFLQDKNYIDITNEYWETKELKCTLFPGQQKPKITYVCTVRGGEWQPVWWGNTKDSIVAFSKMPKGIAYLPVYYKDEEIIPAGYPKVMGYNNEVVLKPDKIKTRSIVIKEQEKYLKFRPEKKYELFYWDNEWKSAGEKITTAETRELIFDKVPSNALYRLVPEYTRGMERPFIITVDGTRRWF
ncbi:MAG: transglutaminase domain-containing protein [Sphingobacteriaceae bacterium]|nr:transglutaminase domain-containing protein [Sphingobacteriaceae bacterium]